jgi:cardiolipin synthase
VNLPNILTLIRILLVPFFVYALIYGHGRWALVVFITAGLTDALDGAIARMCNQQTTLGRYLDPLADKLLLTSAFVALAVLARIPFWVLLIVVSRDIILLVGTVVTMHITQGDYDITPSLLGKVTTFFQLAFVLCALLLLNGVDAGAWFEAALVMVVGLTTVSGLHYLYRGIRAMNGEPA